MCWRRALRSCQQPTPSISQSVLETGDITTARITGTKGTDGCGFPAIAIGAVGFMAITYVVALGIEPTLGIIIGITAITIATTIAGIGGTIAGIASRSVWRFRAPDLKGCSIAGSSP